MWPIWYKYYFTGKCVIKNKTSECECLEGWTDTLCDHEICGNQLICEPKSKIFFKYLARCVLVDKEMKCVAESIVIEQVNIIF